MTDAARRGEALRARFPSTRPAISVVPIAERLEPIRCLELQWGLAVPLAGARTSYAKYDIETQMLDSVVEVATIGPSRIHDVDCMELSHTEWSARSGWHPTESRWYCRIGDERTEWLAVDDPQDGLITFRDEGFASQWGGVGPQMLVDDGGYTVSPTGGFVSTARGGFGVGACRVVIGDRGFVCLRVLERVGPPNEEDAEVSEAFVTTSGRTVLYRQYRGRLMPYDKTQDPSERTAEGRFPNNARIILDDNVYVHADCTGKARDVITATAWGLEG